MSASPAKPHYGPLCPADTQCFLPPFRPQMLRMISVSKEPLNNFTELCLNLLIAGTEELRSAIQCERVSHIDELWL